MAQKIFHRFKIYILTIVFLFYITGNYAQDWEIITYDDFEGGWGNYTDGDGEGYSNIYCDLKSYAPQAHQGTYSAFIIDDISLSSSFYYTDGKDVSGFDEIKISFWFYIREFDSNDYFAVEYYNGTQWYIIASFYGPLDYYINGFQYREFIINKSLHVFPVNMKIRFRNISAGINEWIAFDEINIVGRTLIGVEEISISPTNQILQYGDQAIINYNISPSNATYQEVTWTSDNPSVATVNSNGVVSPVYPGIATISATTVDGGFTASSQVTVKHGVPDEEYNALAALYTETGGGESWTISWDLNGFVQDFEEVTVTNNSVTGISLDNKGLSGEIPIEISDLQNLESLSLQTNFLSVLPNISIMANLSDQLYINYNYFTFEDIEPNMGLLSGPAQYAPQRDFDLPFSSIILQPGQYIDIVLDYVGGENNRYTWTLNGDIEESESLINTIRIDDISTVSCQVTNTMVSGLAINSTEAVIDVNYLTGDVTNDLDVTAFDASLVLLYSVGYDELDFWNVPKYGKWEKWRRRAANAFDDGTIEIEAYDATNILLFVTGQVGVLPQYPSAKSATSCKVKVTENNGWLEFSTSGDLLAFELTVKGGNAASLGEAENLTNSFLLAQNHTDTLYRLAMAGAYPVDKGEPFLRIPVTQNCSLGLQMKVNATEQAIEFDIAASVNGPLAHIDAVIKHFPNPFSEGARIEVTSNYVGEILFEAYALTGKKICAQKGHHNGSGATSFMLDAAHAGQELDKGAYIYVVTMDGKRYTNSIVKQ